ncbi:RCC1/BLIP-II [Sarocladium strictum]
MNVHQSGLRRATALTSSISSSSRAARRQWARHVSNSGQQQIRRGGNRTVGILTVFGVGTAAAYYYPQIKQWARGDEQIVQKTKKGDEPAKAVLEFEKPRKAPVSKEDNRDLISSQHLQVKKSWEHPGVYAWGSNVGKVIDPESNEKYVKQARRIPFFDDQLLRDIKLTAEFGAAVTEKGDLVQWGLGFSKADPKPMATLIGRDIAKIEVSADRILALTKAGSVLSIPASRDDQEGGAKVESSGSSWSLWSGSGGKEKISFRELTPKNLARGEKVKDVRSGQDHCLMLTSTGRVFSAASSAADFPSRGQMGIPGLTWGTRPEGPYDQAHEVAILRGFNAQQIATGDQHSLVLDQTGRVFSFGDNTFGQLGFEGEAGQFIDTPTMINVNKLYNGTGLVPQVTSVKAGGQNTFFTVDAQARTAPDGSALTLAPAKRMPRTVTDLWASGRGVYGALGTGKWTHITTGPAKVKALSSLFEFDEKTNKMCPIKLKSLSVGATHVSATMDNVTEVSISNRGTENETNWGADVMFWGGNENYQLGTGKRNNLNAPAYIGPLDGGLADADAGRKGEMHRLCLTPRSTARIGEDGKGRKVTLEQKVECGRNVTAVYSSV